MWFCFYSPSKYFMKDSLIHTVTLPFIMGSDAVRLKPHWCGKKGWEYSASPTFSTERTWTCQTHGTSLLHLTERRAPKAHSHDLWRHTGISRENSVFFMSLSEMSLSSHWLCMGPGITTLVYLYQAQWQKLQQSWWPDMVVQCDSQHGEGGICVLKCNSVHSLYKQEAEHF